MYSVHLWLQGRRDAGPQKDSSIVNITECAFNDGSSSILCRGPLDPVGVVCPVAFNLSAVPVKALSFAIVPASNADNSSPQFTLFPRALDDSKYLESCYAIPNQSGKIVSSKLTIFDGWSRVQPNVRT